MRRARVSILSWCVFVVLCLLCFLWFLLPLVLFAVSPSWPFVDIFFVLDEIRRLAPPGRKSSRWELRKTKIRLSRRSFDGEPRS